MSNIIKELRLSLATENDKVKELPDGSDLTTTKDEVPENMSLSDVAADPRLFDEVQLEQLATESEISVDERVLERLVANGDILTDIDLALEAYASCGMEFNDLVYRGIKKTYDLLAGEHKLPSLESALSLHEGDRRLLTLATEAAVTDRVKDLWKRAVDAIINLFQRIKDWYLRVWDQAPRLQERAKRILAVSGKVSGSASVNFVELSAVKELGIDGKPPTVTAFVGKLNDINTITSRVLNTVASDYNKLSNELIQITKQSVEKAIDENKKRNDETLSTSRNSIEVPKTTLGEQDKLLATFISRFERMIKSIGLAKEPKKDDPRFSTENTIYRISNPLPGDKMFTAAYPDKSTDVTPDLGRIKYAFGIGVIDVVDGKKDIESKGDFPTLSLPDIDKLTQTAINLTTIVMGYKRLYQECEKVSDNLLKELQRLSKISDDLDATSRRNITSSVNGAVTIHKTMVSGEGKWVKYVMSVVKYMLDWCEESLRQYSSKS